MRGNILKSHNNKGLLPKYIKNSDNSIMKRQHKKIGKEFKQTLSKEGMQIPNKQLKQCPISLGIKEMQT